MNDPRFDYGDVPSWRKEGKQSVFSTYITELQDFNVLDPLPGHLEWDIETKNPVIFDGLTRFDVTVAVQVSTKGNDIPAVAAAGAAAAVPLVPGVWGDYTDCREAEYADFILAPVWFEKIFTMWVLFHLVDQPKLHSELPHIPFELNTFLYWAMGKDLKDSLCRELWHPGRAVPTPGKKWNFDADGAWHEYSRHLLKGRAMSFGYYPLHFWPLFQGTNNGRDRRSFCPRALNTRPSNLNGLGKVSLRAKLVDRIDNLFRIRDGVNNKRYRLKINKFKLVVEEAVMNPSGDRSLLPRGKTLFWPGVCKVMRNETIPAGSFIHSVKFTETVWPEMILVFALSRNVVGGSYKYSDHAIADPHFMRHNIEQVNISYDSYLTSMVAPDFGTVNSAHAERNVARNYARYGIFGMQVDPAVINETSAIDGFVNTDFPHVVVHLVQSDGWEDEQIRTRTMPLLTDKVKSLDGKPKDLVLTLKFGNVAGSTAEATYVVYLGYTDTNLFFKDGKFQNPYGLH